MAKGILITFEGMEGSGKTTHAALLAERLRGMGRDPLLTREPGGTQLGQRVREILLDPRTGALDPLTELLLFSAARRELVTQVIAPALAEGRVVLCDRYADSTRAYQGHGRGVDRDLIGRVASLVIAGATPARTLLFDLPPEEGLARAINRNAREGGHETRFENELLDFHRRVRDGFLAIARAEPDRVAVIDAAAPVEQVKEAVFAAVAGALARLA